MSDRNRFASRLLRKTGRKLVVLAGLGALTYYLLEKNKPHAEVEHVYIDPTANPPETPPVIIDAEATSSEQ